MRLVLVTGGSRRHRRHHFQSVSQAGGPGRCRPARLRCSARCSCDQVDVFNPQEIAAAFKEARDLYGPVEVLVNNAGIAGSTLLTGMRDERFFRVLETNLDGSFCATWCAYPHMARMGRGRASV
ncbi:SDR family NAD(P)-dependent oxidoreductase [Streptomyces sp. NBC_01390]